MLTQELSDLLKYDVGEVLRSPLLLMQMLRLYSKIFLHDQPCSTCEKKHEGYYQMLASKGFEQIKKNKAMQNEKPKYLLKPGVVMHTPEGMYSEFNITDTVSRRLVKSFPALAGNYINPPVIEPEVIPEPEVTPEPEVKVPEVKTVVKGTRAKKHK